MPECNVEGCEDDAVAAIVGEDGYATAYRCRDCLVFDKEGSRKIYLLGVHSATFYRENDPSREEQEKYDLNLGWYPELILEILEEM
jgi:hypothetical protein